MPASPIGFLPRRVACALSVVSIVALHAACASVKEAPLLVVSGVSTSSLEAGESFELRGAGFPVGRTGEVRFEGELRRPAQPPAHVRAVARAFALAEDRIDCAPPEDVFAAGGTFEGTLEVAFPQHDGRGLVVGTLRDVHLELEPPVDLRLREERKHRARAKETLAFLGATVSEEQSGLDGVTLEQVAPNGRAAAAGIASGDVVLSVDGARVHAVSDLAPPEGALEARWLVRRAGEAAPVTLTISLRDLSALPPLVELVAYALAIVLLLCFLLYATPLARFSHWLVDVMAHTVRVAHGTPVESSRAARAALVAGHVAMLVAVPLVAQRLPTTVDAVTLFATAVIVRRAALWSRVATGAKGGGGSLRKKAAAVLGHYGHDIALACSLAAPALLAGTSALSGVVHTQGAFPWRWFAFSGPGGWCAVTTFFWVASRPDADARRGDRGFLARSLDEVPVWILAVTAVAAFFGGWQLPYLDLGPRSPWLVLGGVVFGLKAWALVAVLQRVRSARELDVPSTTRFVQGTVLVVLCAASNTAQLFSPLPTVVERVVALAACIAVSLFVVLAFLSRVRTAWRSGLVVHPFL